MNLQLGFFTYPMTLLCIVMLFIMVDMQFIASLASLLAKKLLGFADNMSIFVHGLSVLYFLLRYFTTCKH